MNVSIAENFGSSLLARGKPPDHSCSQTTCGIIPACAGKSPAEAWAAAKPGDHPCLRGENRQSGVGRNVDLGSSLRERGKLAVRLDQPGQLRLIPA